MSRRAFTLIELLVVIAIIGVLSAVVIAAVNIGRNKGLDATIRSDINGARPQSNLFYDANGYVYVSASGTGTANDVCNIAADGSATGGVRGIFQTVSAAATVAKIGSVSYNAPGGPGIVVCNASEGDGDGWAAEVPLMLGGFYCVDSTGVASTSASSMIASSTDVLCN
jgi:prepilin-type N-terminal cleavage/methylation domain-containing protein